MHTCATVQCHLPSERCAILAGFCASWKSFHDWERSQNVDKTLWKPESTLRTQISGNLSMEPEHLNMYSSNFWLPCLILGGSQSSSRFPGKKSRKQLGMFEPNDMLDIFTFSVAENLMNSSSSRSYHSQSSTKGKVDEASRAWTHVFILT